jgi:hypothetical protein
MASYFDAFEKELFAPFNITESFFVNDRGEEIKGSEKSNLLQKHLGPVLFKVYLIRSFALRIKRESQDIQALCDESGNDTARACRAYASACESSANTVVLETSTTAADIPLDWRPKAKPRGQAVSRANAPIVMGSIVSVREKYRADYEGILEENELDGLTVVRETGSKVWCQTQANTKVHIAKRDLEVTG